MKAAIRFISTQNDKDKIPTLYLKRKQKNVVLKKSQIEQYLDARELLDRIENKQESYQKDIEKQINQIIEDKGKEIDDIIDRKIDELQAESEESRRKWQQNAQETLGSLLEENKVKIDEVLDKIKGSLIKSARSRLIELNVNEKFIQIIVETLHEELNDVERKFKVEIIQNEDKGKTFIIENETCLISLDTSMLIEELMKSIEGNEFV